MAKVSPIPEGFRTLTPYLFVQDAPKAIAFYEQAFGAKECVRLTDPGGNHVRHAELLIGNSPLFLTDVRIDLDMRAPSPTETSPVWMYLYVENPDAVFDRAVDAGCEIVTPVGDQNWGDRYGCVADPFGYRWGIAARKKIIPPEALKKKMTELYERDAAG